MISIPGGILESLRVLAYVSKVRTSIAALLLLLHISLSLGSRLALLQTHFKALDAVKVGLIKLIPDVCCWALALLL